MIKNVAQFELKSKTVLLRLDLNVPLSGEGKITDDTRVQEALPTIKHCIDAGARLVLCSHLGRPKGKQNPKYSLEPVAEHLATLLQKEVILIDEAVGDGVHQLVRHGRDDAVILLENLRFDPGEEANTEKFVVDLAKIADVYINDAFGCTHRKHASTFGVAEKLTEKGIGFLIEKELNCLGKLIQSPEHPFVLVVGGSKVTDKLKAVENLINTVDKIVVGGAMAYAFLSAQGHAIGKSKCEAEGLAGARSILDRAKERGVEIILPQDHIVVYPVTDPDFNDASVCDSIAIPEDAAALDIGPKSVEKFQAAIEGAKTIFWNGPMGLFEKTEFAKGSAKIGETIAEQDALKVCGGGDTISAVKKLCDPSKFDLLSTGGGASLKFLEGRGLPCLEVLDIRVAGARTNDNLSFDE